MKPIAFVLLGLSAAACAETRTLFNDGWRFARFGTLADGSHRDEPGKPVEVIRATSEEAGKGNVATNAIDGNPETRWCAAAGRTGESVTLDLGRVAKVGVIGVMPEKPELECVVEVSADGAGWRKLEAPGAGDSQRFDVGGGDVRQVRVSARNVTPQRWASIREIEVRDVAGAKIEPESKPAGAGPEAVDFDDSEWRPLSLPHDWGIEGPFRMELDGSTGKLPWIGVGWYRKTFTVFPGKRDPETKPLHHYLDIEGAMSDATVYLNGEPVGRWPYGYSSFRVDLGDAVKPGTENVLAVRLDNKDQSSRWYPGAGLYRDVWLVEKPRLPFEFAHNGAFVRFGKLSEEMAEVICEFEVKSRDVQGLDGTRIEDLQAGLKIHTEYFADAADSTFFPGKYAGAVSVDFDVSGAGRATVRMKVPKPRYWSLSDPHRYCLKARAVVGNDLLCDEIEATFGIRTIEFDDQNGFLLNGERVYIKGVCMHHDLGPLGAAFHVEAAERQIRILKEMGCNAIRTSHNPPAPGLVELCDRMGMLLQIEAFDTWDRAKRGNDYARFFPDWHERDLRLMVRNFRNHPSVVMWSTGNEIPGGYQTSPGGWRKADALRKIVKSEDPTRPVTMGNNARGAADHLWKGIDLLGFNYKPDLYAKFQEKKTGVPVYGSETASCISSRGEYFFPVSWDKSKGQANFQMSSYDTSAPPWAQRPDIEFTAQDQSQPWNFGEFVWTGFDYLGEPTPYNNDMTNLLNIRDPEERERLKKQLEEIGRITPPSRSSYFGIVDLCGFPKDRFFLYQARWRPELPMAHLLPHWNWPEREGEVTPVHVYTSGDEAELFLNGASLGRKKRGPEDHRLVWEDVTYRPGELRVVAYKDGRRWAEADRSTTGDATKLVAEVETIGDMSFVEITVVDNEGREVPRSNPELVFEAASGVGILAAGNGDATSHVTMWRAERMPAYNGKCLVIVEGKGRLKVVSEGLEPATVELP